ncbi:MAG TPA: glycerophosphodiester phosphodiesterase [Thermoleophilaceae bacterium]
MAFKRVGHKGAGLVAPGNTKASFDAALAAGVDMVEFDVLARDYRDPENSELVLSHDYDHLAKGPVLTLEEGLAHLADRTFADVDFNVDLKTRGYERRVVEALRRHGLVDRVLISTYHLESLDAVRELEPRIRLGWSVPNVRRDYTRSKLMIVPALILLQAFKRLVPGRAAREIRRGRCHALMAHWRLVTRRLVRAVHDAGGELYVWTVDEAPAIRRLEALGVDGIISNDPRLFAGG